MRIGGSGGLFSLYRSSSFCLRWANFSVVFVSTGCLKELPIGRAAPMYVNSLVTALVRFQVLRSAYFYSLVPLVRVLTRLPWFSSGRTASHSLLRYLVWALWMHCSSWDRKGIYSLFINRFSKESCIFSKLTHVTRIICDRRTNNNTAHHIRSELQSEESCCSRQLVCVILWCHENVYNIS